MGFESRSFFHSLWSSWWINRNVWGHYHVARVQISQILSHFPQATSDQWISHPEMKHSQIFGQTDVKCMGCRFRPGCTCETFCPSLIKITIHAETFDFFLWGIFNCWPNLSTLSSYQWSFKPSSYTFTLLCTYNFPTAPLWPERKSKRNSSSSTIHLTTALLAGRTEEREACVNKSSDAWLYLCPQQWV